MIQKQGGFKFWSLVIICGALGAFLGSYLTFFFSPEDAKVLIERKVKTIFAPKIADDDNRLYHVFIQFYPSTKEQAKEVKNLLESTKFSIVHFQGLSERKLSPRKSEIIYYSEVSQKKSNEIQKILDRQLELNISVSESPYFGDKYSKYKIFINLF